MTKNCPNCGAPIDIHRIDCEYCGTPYELNEDEVETVIFYADNVPVESIKRRNYVRHS